MKCMAQLLAGMKRGVGTARGVQRCACSHLSMQLCSFLRGLCDLRQACLRWMDALVASAASKQEQGWPAPQLLYSFYGHRFDASSGISIRSQLKGMPLLLDHATDQQQGRCCHDHP